MKLCPALFFSLLIATAHAQVEDHFDDGDFSGAPAWSGDNSEFNVNPARQLQLNAAAAGFSYLSVPAGMTSLDSCEWRFYIHLNFSPSSSNYSKVYLSSDNANLDQPLNGYFLKFGESLSNDAIELFKQNGSTITSVCRATNGMIAGPFHAGVKVQRNTNGQWILSVDYSGGTNYIPEATGIDSAFHEASFIGLTCEYTGGNTDNFFYDDFYAGPALLDTILPFITIFRAESVSVLSLTFSEPMYSSSVTDLSHYHVDNGLGNPIAIYSDTVNTRTYYLQFNNQFLPGVNYTLFMSGIKDLSSNVLADSVASFVYTPLLIPQMNDVVFTEIYFEPSSSSLLPNSEFVEIYNRADSAINVAGWVVTDGSSDGILPAFLLKPHEYKILYNADDSSLFSGIGQSVPVDDFPTLNNDFGDHLKLINDRGDIMAEVVFSDESYHDQNKNDGGWSIERIDPDFICKNENNWTASIDNRRGTPGTVNSVNHVFTDNDNPQILSAFLSDSFSVCLVFNEPVDDSAFNIQNYYSVSPEGDELYPLSAFCSSEMDSVFLNFSSQFNSGVYSLHVSSGIKDCPGNAYDAKQLVKLGFPEKANTGDVLINEILFNPFEGGKDFLEVYNCSEKIVNLKDWLIEERDAEDSLAVKESGKISEGNKLLFPGEYLVFTESEEYVKPYYDCPEIPVFLKVSSMPDFNSDKGRAGIYNEDGIKMDGFIYNEDMHFPLITDHKGISLERITNCEMSSTNYWHSAAATAGFATPGYRNSQWIEPLSGEQEVFVGEEVFSPDNDGYADVLTIHYSYPQTGTVLSLNVYDYAGFHVRTLLDGVTTGNEGIVTWDGLNDENVLLSSGIYILLANSFDLEGNKRLFKKAVFLTGKF